ncbi:MAG: hypothetical protein U0031_21105 [Thermomicrobiales bacterium]
MADSERRTWSEALNALRDAGEEVVSSLRGMAGPEHVSDRNRAQFAQDIARFDRSVNALVAKLEQEIDVRRSTVDAAIDRDQVSNSSAKLRESLIELSGQAQRLTDELGTAAADTMKEVEPELNTAIRDLDAVIGAARSWLRAAIDPTGEAGSGRPAATRPSLDDL